MTVFNKTPDTLDMEQATENIVYCEWFALCDHIATKTRRHPILGDVPICDRCDDKIEKL